MHIPELNFESISFDKFMSEYWNKKPVLLKNALPDFECPIDGNELAGIAMEDDVHARLISERQGGVEVKHGPFSEEDYFNVADSKYCLLVQEVETIVPEIAELKKKFRFISDWRSDDIMMSYANDGGTVGAHTDYFDVFLIQGSGKREWQIGEKLSEEPDYYLDMPVRIMREFIPTEKFILEPGDILYLPPMVPHNGIAIGESITLSVGFRNPSISEIAEAWLGAIKNQHAEIDRLEEVVGAYDSSNPSEISPLVIDKVRDLLTDFIKDEQSVAQWFGKMVTQPVRGDVTGELSRLVATADYERLKSSLQSAFEETDLIFWNESVRISFFKLSDTLKVFIDGEAFEMELDCLPGIKKLTSMKSYSKQQLLSEKSDSFIYFVAALLELNILYVGE